MKMRNKISVNDIKSNITPYEFYRLELPDAKLNRHNWNDGGLCPFHDDKSKGSFRVNLETGAFKCFACATSGGDIVAFTMLKLSCDFIEAIQILAMDWGL
jgi:DNA primase